MIIKYIHYSQLLNLTKMKKKQDNKKPNQLISSLNSR